MSSSAKSVVEALPALAAEVKSVSPTAWTSEHCGMALSLLLAATLSHESKTAARDREVETIRKKYTDVLEQAGSEITELTSRIEGYHVAHKAELPEGQKSRQFGAGTIGTRSISNPALVPLNEKWDWDRIKKRAKRLFKARFFRKPTPPELDKMKIKREFDAEELARLGLKLDDSESFYIDLNRLQEAA